MPLLHTVPEACQLLRRGKSIIWEKIKRKELDARRDGKRVLITRESIERAAANLPPRESGVWKGHPSGKPQPRPKPKRKLRRERQQRAAE